MYLHPLDIDVEGTKKFQTNNEFLETIRDFYTLRRKKKAQKREKR